MTGQLMINVPPFIRRLNLSKNNFWISPGDALVAMMGAIPAFITHLNLSNNMLSDKTGTELAGMVSAITHVTHLDVSNNELGNKTIAELEEMMSNTSSSVRFVDLRGNGLGNKTGSELARMIAAFPDSVTDIDLRGNDLDMKVLKNIDDRKAIVDAILNSGKNVIVDFYLRKVLKTQQRLPIITEALIPSKAGIFNSAVRHAFEAEGSDPKVLKIIGEFLHKFSPQALRQLAALTQQDMIIPSNSIVVDTLDDKEVNSPS